MARGKPADICCSPMLVPGIFDWEAPLCAEVSRAPILLLVVVGGILEWSLDSCMSGLRPRPINPKSMCESRFVFGGGMWTFPCEVAITETRKLKGRDVKMYRRVERRSRLDSCDIL